MKKCRRIILFYPAYEQGGATKVLVNLVNFFLKKKIFVELLSLNAEYKNFKKSRYLNIANISKNRQKNCAYNQGANAGRTAHISLPRLKVNHRR